MKNKLGVMQGRLVPKYQGNYQAFPVGYWTDEFFIAEKLGLDLIEFILDYNDAELNPLLRDDGIEQIKFLMQQTGVFVESICADYFMQAPLHSENLNTAQSSVRVLKRLINNAAALKITDIVIPCVDASSLKTASSQERLVTALNEMTLTIETANINLCLETDLSPPLFFNLLDQLPSKNVTVNYDIGNSASLGFDPEEEIKYYGHRITDVHIKDREFAGNSVLLGKGASRFKTVFSLLAAANYEGPFIMQAYRDDEGLDLFKKQFEYIKVLFHG
ncbi:sugar phosphate isomerase/epimerase [Alphaproteobacteria bacterium]|nr:sugar phosphate isomerase/epimerase [Alphaproteobacteria bacterium]